MSLSAKETALINTAFQRMMSEVGVSGHSDLEFISFGSILSDLQTASTGAVLSVGAVGSTPAAAGASISGSTLTLQPADSSHPGVVTAGTQTLAGDKTLTGVTTMSGATAVVTGILHIAGGIWSDTSGGYVLVPSFLQSGDTGLRSNIANGATAIAVKIANGVALTTAGAKVCSFYSDNASTEVAAIDKDGAVQLNISGAAKPAAGAGNRGKVWVEQGGGGAADVAYVCLKSAGGIYSWVTLATG